MSTVNELREKAILFKREGKYDEAIQCYSDALKEDNSSFDALHTYYGLAKIAYLKDDPSYAIRAYLAAVHLELCHVEKDMAAGTMPEQLKEALRQIPQEAVVQLPHPAAGVLYFDRDKPRHVAHAFMDFNEEFLETEQNRKYAQAYKAQLRGDDSYEQVLTEQGITDEEVRAAEFQFYWPFGARFFMQNGIDWSRLSSTNVFEIYFESEERTIR